jgi:prepilin-type N-terminal cleavage/methylation domain-containing protein
VARRKNNRGFVLIEVLVAVAVAAVLLVALLRSFTTTWFGISTVREEAEATMVARSLISAVTPRDKTVEVSQQGTTGRYSWLLEVKKVPLPPPAPVTNAADSSSEPETPFSWTLYRVGVIVTAPSGRRTTLETSRLSRP